MKAVLKQLLSSKKFTVALATTLVWAVSLIGFDVDVETMTAILSPLYAYVIGQGVADAGKHKQLGGGQ